MARSQPTRRGDGRTGGSRESGEDEITGGRSERGRTRQLRKGDWERTRKLEVPKVRENVRFREKREWGKTLRVGTGRRRGPLGAWGTENL